MIFGILLAIATNIPVLLSLSLSNIYYILYIVKKIKKYKIILIIQF